MAPTLILGLLFLVVGFAAVFLMFHLWGYPFDKATRTSAAPRSLMLLHRGLGYLYLALYLVMMWKMVPRLWEYQVELPPRSVVHMLLAITIGVLLLVKISILRFFRHLEEWMPVLGALLLACTILLSALSMPFAFRELSLANSAGGAGVYSAENLERVAKLLPQAELPPEVKLGELATPAALTAGREVLASKCVVCHDLKTILSQPRSPAGWWSTVERMASKPSFAEPLEDRELHVVTAYLIAISSDLQKSVKERRKEEDKRKVAVADIKQDIKGVVNSDDSGSGDLPPFDDAVATRTYEALCSQCHDLADVEAKPPKTSDDVKNVIIRMLSENGMEASKEQLDLVYLHMVKKFAGGKVLVAKPAPKPAEPAPAEPAPTEPSEPAPTPTDKPADKPAKPADKPDKPAKPDPKIDGKPLYEKSCKACHAIDGKGSPAMKASNIPDFTDPAWQKGHGKAKVIAAITNGVYGTKMKAFDDKLSADEIAAVAAHVKKLK
ncbi:MAG: c-type cytochrome [Nannocystis sp.]|uniref:c-type cytochrome n=1 Tax=Nannocystis sp. TaxID=1962667 RepID=UPI002426777B|nr:c-type cytochrome [Nannocystis sp.]MBK9752336.1 c-type cytochrome [Nannocystis sp.]